MHTILSLVHLVGLCLAFGAIFVADLSMGHILIRRRVRKSDLHLLQIVDRLVVAGLAILISSGCGFMMEYWSNSPDLLKNPKLYAKIFVVMVIIANGMVLHWRILPMLHDLAAHQKRIDFGNPCNWQLLACGAISTLSWWTAFTLGTVRELNFNVSFLGIATVYMLIVFVGVTSSLLIGTIISHPSSLSVKKAGMVKLDQLRTWLRRNHYSRRFCRSPNIST